ncbi:MAG: ABC transporter substrate-binding protein [Candidatus Zipacnadales bacterium]
MYGSRDRHKVVWGVLLVGGMVIVWWWGGCVRVVEVPRQIPVGNSTRLSFAFWAIDSQEVELVHELVDRFEQVNPDLRVDVIDIPAKYYEKLMTLFAADVPPDIFVLNYGRLSDFARRGLLKDLAGFLRADTELQPQDFVPVAFDAFSAVGKQVGRPGLYGLPRDWGPTGLIVYNKSAFAEAGVDPPMEDWTWAEFAAACRKLTLRGEEGEVIRYGGSLNLYPYSMVGWFYQNGAQIVSDGGLRSELDGTACVKTVEFLYSLVREQVVRPPNLAQDDSLEAFKQGQTAMAFITPYSVAQLRECDSITWGVAPPLVGKQQGCGCIPTGVAIATSCKQPAEAYRLARFWVTEGGKAYARAGLAVPAYQLALESGALEAGFGEAAAEVVRRSAKLAKPYPILRNVAYEEQLAALRQALEEIFTLGAPPAKALQRAAAHINAHTS